MSVGFLEVKDISRNPEKGGRSATAAAAYRCALNIKDDQTGARHSYSRREGVESYALVGWSGTVSSLANAIEKAEKRKDSYLAREVILALPHETTAAERLELATKWAEWVRERHGVAAIVAVHTPGKKGDARNFHAHIMLTSRVSNGLSLTRKTRELDVKTTSGAHIEAWRAEWGRMIGQDMRSYLRRGLDVTPEPKLPIKPEREAWRERRDQLVSLRQQIEESEIELRQANLEANAEVAAEIFARPELLLHKVTQMNSVFTVEDLMKELHHYVDDEGIFNSVMQRLADSPELVRLGSKVAFDTGAPKSEVPVFSSIEMVELERAMVESARRMSGSFGPGGRFQDPLVLSAALARHSTLNAEQRLAIQHVCGTAQIAAIVGDAGTGKSFSMKVAREVWEAQGLRVRGAAVAGKAAAELASGSGIETSTLARLERACESGRDPLTANDVLVIDEAGMIGSRQMAKILRMAEDAGSKVVLLGDHKQLAAVDAGAAFRAIVDRIGGARLEQIRRQQAKWALDASMAFARRECSGALDAYDRRGFVKVHDTKDQARRDLAAAWLSNQDKGSQIVLAHSNAEVHALNAAIRDARKAAGGLTREVTVNARSGALALAGGDRVVFLTNDKKLEVANGTLATVKTIDEKGRFIAVTDDGKSRLVDPAIYNNFGHGYALSIHKSQGVTVDRTLVMATRGLESSLSYVAMTRHRKEAQLFASAEEFLHAGMLVEHGEAVYDGNDAGLDAGPGDAGKKSYFVVTIDDKGVEQKIWGVDLKRAIQASGAQLGDQVALERTGTEDLGVINGSQWTRNTWAIHRGGTDRAAWAAATRRALSRSVDRVREKSTTLDYLSDFAEVRGYRGETVVSAWLKRVKKFFARLVGQREQATEQLLRSRMEAAGVPADVLGSADKQSSPVVSRVLVGTLVSVLDVEAGHQRIEVELADGTREEIAAPDLGDQLMEKGLDVGAAVTACLYQSADGSYWTIDENPRAAEQHDEAVAPVPTGPVMRG